MSKLKALFLAALILLIPLSASDGKIVNPVTDVCWKCLFPITVAGKNITPGSQDPIDYSPGLCFCAGTPPQAGIPITFWEPAYLVEVTRTPYKLHALGGITIGSPGVRHRGAISNVGGSGRSSFYNVHFYQFPVMKWLGVFDEFSCMDLKKDLSVLYMSEFDPMWNSDEWAHIVSPEASLFANPLAQTACIADCISSSAGKPLDSLFWCAGCSGSLYPYVGHVPHHIGGIQASHLLTQRIIAKLHSIGLLRTYSKSEFCQPKITPRIHKSAYKTQLIYPSSNSKGPCPPLGQSEALWGAEKSYPNGGEDFVYLIWVKKHCCLDAVKPAIKSMTGGAK